MFNKKTSIKFSELVKVVKNEYSIIQVIPSKSNRNNSTSDILHLVNKMYTKLDKMLRIENKKLIINTQMKLSYFIHITKSDISFFFIVPTCHLSKFKIKLNEVWKNIDVKEVDALPVDVNSCTKYQLKYQLNDSLSLESDKRSNELLNSNLSVIDILEKDESVSILYNFIPTSERENNYHKSIYQNTIDNYRSGQNMKKYKNIADLGIISIKFLIGIINDLINSILSNDKKVLDVFIGSTKEISPSTNKKAKNDICKSQVVILSKSNDKSKEKELNVATYNTFNSIDGDNRLISKELKKDINIFQTTLDASVNYTSVDECSNFVALPGRELINSCPIINHVPHVENMIPKCLQNGNMFIGLVNYKEKVYEAFFSTHQEYQNLERVLIGSKGSGKSHKMINIAKNAIDIGRGVVVIDIIEDCKLSKSIADHTPKDKLIRIRCNKKDEIQSFSYSEIKINNKMSNYDIFSNAVKRTQQLQILLDSINDDATKLSSRMIKFLFSAGAIVYAAKPNASLSEVFECLENPSKRHNYIDSLNDELKELLNKRIEKVLELDEKDSKGNIKGNKDSKIEGILDRAALLDSMSAHLEFAMNKTSDNDIDFVKAIRENKVILIEIPEQEFPSAMLRNIMATFFLSKVWLAKQILASEEYQPTTELMFDEFYKCHNAQQLFEVIFAEARKYKLITTVAIHNLAQLNSKCRMTLKSGGASYILMSGADVSAFRELKHQLERFGYEEEDFLELKQYTAMCLIKNEDEGYNAFIANIPPNNKGVGEKPTPFVHCIYLLEKILSANRHMYIFKIIIPYCISKNYNNKKVRFSRKSPDSSFYPLVDEYLKKSGYIVDKTGSLYIHMV